jgi:uncharacterized delta-60 repeat protein
VEACFFAVSVILPDAGSPAPTYAMVLQSNGHPVIAGNLLTPTNAFTFGLIRYTVNGGIDTTFGSNGGVSTTFPGQANAIAYALAVQSNGELIAAGQAYNSLSQSQFALARYLGSGSLDPSFGTGGRVVSSFSGSSKITGMVLQPDGKIVVVGDIGRNLAVARYLAQ